MTPDGFSSLLVENASEFRLILFKDPERVEWHQLGTDHPLRKAFKKPERTDKKTEVIANEDLEDWLGN